jgi:hypothetical protein
VRNSKKGGRFKHPLLGVPKFIQFSEAVKEGGCLRRRKNEVRGKEISEQIQESGEDSSTGRRGGVVSGKRREAIQWFLYLWREAVWRWSYCLQFQHPLLGSICF